jgi:hypothetical protein
VPHNFGSIAEYKINIQPSVVFLYTNNDKTEKEIRNKISFIIALKQKQLGINFTKKMEGL